MNTHHTSNHHRHQPASTSTRHGFYGCVNWKDCNPAAHFAVSTVDTCVCGATRMNNHNDDHTEVEVGIDWGFSNDLASTMRRRQDQQRVLTAAAAAREQAAASPVEAPVDDPLTWTDRLLDDRYGCYVSYLANPITDIVRGDLLVVNDWTRREIREALIRGIERTREIQKAINGGAPCLMMNEDHTRLIHEEAADLLAVAEAEWSRRRAA